MNKRKFLPITIAVIEIGYATTWEQLLIALLILISAVLDFILADKGR
jgi:hypothetical protein